jgi:iron(III) transport system substrate-binding protein
MKTRLLLLTALLSLSMLFTACSPAPSEPTQPPDTEETEAPTAAEEETTASSETEEVEETQAVEAADAPSQVTVYISPASLGTALEEAFEAEHGDVLNVVSGSWCRKIKSEQEAGDIVADVIYGAEPVFFRELAETGDLLAYTPESLSDVQAEYRWDNGYYFPADLRYIGIVYNKTLVGEADVPTSYAGINDPMWAQMTTVADATQCASAFAIAAALSPDMDMSFFEDAKTNNALISDRAGKLPETVASGEAALGVGPHDPVVRLQKKAQKEGAESPLAIAWNEEGTYVLPRPIAIIADENRAESATEVAQLFVDFVLSRQGQTMAVNKAGFVSVRSDVELPAQVPANLTLLSLDWDWAAENKPEFMERFQEIMYGGD